MCGTKRNRHQQKAKKKATTTRKQSSSQSTKIVTRVINECRMKLSRKKQQATTIYRR